MTFPCFLCDRYDARTNCGGLYCADCQELPDHQKRAALERQLGSAREELAQLKGQRSIRWFFHSYAVRYETDAERDEARRESWRQSKRRQRALKRWAA